MGGGDRSDCRARRGQPEKTVRCEDTPSGGDVGLHGVRAVALGLGAWGCRRLGLLPA